MNNVFLETMVICRCIKPGLSCCEHRFVNTGRESTDNVFRHPVWCGKWRGVHAKDMFYHFCEKEYEV
jgi:hypothetical protein